MRIVKSTITADRHAIAREGVVRRPTGNQTAAGTAVSSIALIAAQYFFAVAPQTERANANMNSNFDCSAALEREQAETTEWRDRWFDHAQAIHGW